MIPEQANSRRNVFAWTLFDFANTAFYVIVLTVGFPTYFREVVAGNTPIADLLWSISFSSSMFIVALLSPILGAAADGGAGKKRFLALFTILCILATASLYFVEGGMIVRGMIFLILANIGFEAGLVFYDAFLPEITSERSYGRVSGYGYAMGYVGSLVTLLLAFPLYQNGFEISNLLNVRLSFLLAASFFLLFAIPLFIFLPDLQRKSERSLEFVRTGFQRVVKTFREISQYRNVGRFLLSYFVYIDGVNTIIVFSAIFARQTLKFELSEIILFFALVQTSAILGSIIFGILSDHIGQKKTLTITLVIWVLIVIAAYFVMSKMGFYVIGLFAGIAMGSSQSISRSLMSHLTPVHKKTEFFGFFSFFGKASAIVGPLIFGIISTFADQRTAIVSVGVLLLLGLILLQRVVEPAKTK